MFDVGEHAKVVIISVTEGQDKPLKYPHMFSVADLVIVNKTDLLPYVDFDLETFNGHAQSLNRGVEIVSMSVKSGDGLADWYRLSADDVCGRLHPIGEPGLLDSVRGRMLRREKLQK